MPLAAYFGAIRLVWRRALRVRLSRFIAVALIGLVMLSAWAGSSSGQTGDASLVGFSLDALFRERTELTVVLLIVLTMGIQKLHVVARRLMCSRIRSNEPTHSGFAGKYYEQRQVGRMLVSVGVLASVWRVLWLAIAWLLSLLPLAHAANPVPGLSLIFPVPSGYTQKIFQDYAEFDDGSLMRHHAGIDIPAPLGTTVVAAAGGIAHVITLAAKGNVTHCFGNAVIIDHGSSATLYGHLNSVSIAEGSTVVTGQIIGVVGNTTGLLADAVTSCDPNGATGYHLHFELKDIPSPKPGAADLRWLGDPASNTTWGYTPGPVGTTGSMVTTAHPDSWGFHDPTLNIATGVVTLSPAFTVETKPLPAGYSQVNLRVGPDTSYRIVKGVSVAGSQFTAIRQSAASSGCPQGWYQLINTNGSYFADSISNSSGQGASHTPYLPDVWACIGDAAVTFIGPLVTMDMTPPSIGSFAVTPSTITSSQPFAITYSVSDAGGSGLNRVVLRRTSGDGSASDPGWSDITTNSASGNGPVSGSFNDIPPSVGAYWYGIAAFDIAGHSKDERQSGLGPLQVTVTPTTNVRSSAEPVCDANKALGSYAICRIETPATYSLSWAGNYALNRAARATVLINGTDQSCTGTLVGTTPSTNFAYVLTAAHCFPNDVQDKIVHVSITTNYMQPSCTSPSNLTSGYQVFQNQSAKLVHLDHAKDTALLLLQSTADASLTNIGRIRVDNGDFADGQPYFNPNHPSGAPLRLHGGTAYSHSSTFTPASGVSPPQVTDEVKMVWTNNDEVTEHISSGSGLFAVESGEPILKATLTGNQGGICFNDGSAILQFPLIPIQSAFAKVKNSYSQYSHFLNPDSVIVANLSGSGLTGQFEVQLHFATGGLAVPAQTASSSNGFAVTFSSVPTGNYYLEVYQGGVKVGPQLGESSAGFTHDRNNCASPTSDQTTEYACTTISQAKSISVKVPVGTASIQGVTPADGFATISFAASTTGSTPTSYSVSCSATGQVTRSQTGMGSPIVVGGLTNGIAYSCTVIAKNTEGEGPSSNPISVTPVAPTAVPTIRLVTFPSVIASSTQQTITVAGSGFDGSAGPSASKLVFTDPNSVVLPARTPSVQNSGSLTYISSFPTAGTWKVNVVNGTLESAPYSFVISPATAVLSGLAISGPATVSEGGTGNFTATALLSDGSQSVAAASWTVTGTVASIDAVSGQLSAGAVAADTAVTVTASFASGGLTKTASTVVTILHANAVGGGLTTELITNGGFESGTTGWVMVGPVVPTTSHYPHTGIGYAVMGEANNSADTMYQLITVPANATAATLSYWYNILSDEPGTTPYDSLNVSIRNTSGTVLSTVDIKWNTDKDAGPGNPYYRQKTFDLLPYRGQQVQIHFLASTDSTNKSYLKIDDVSVLATVSPAASVTGLLISGPTSVAESSSASYTATAVFSDGSTSVVTPTSWSVTASSGSINASGLLMTNAVNTDTPTTVSASYTVGGATFNASTNITVVDVQVVVNNNLSVNKVGTGSGTITSSDSSISCGSTCIASYGNGTNMTLNAVPSNGSTFGSWAGCDSVNGTSCTVSMAFSRIVSVTFNQIVVTSYTVTTAPAGNGVGTITSAPGGSCISNTTCPGSYTLPAGTAVTISATAASGSVFAGWSAGYGSAYLCTGSSTCEFSLSEASTVNAIFVRQQFGLQLSLTGTGGGAVVSTPVGVNCTGGTCSSNFNSGTSVTLNATAAGGSVFAGWLGCPSAVGATCTIAMDMAQNVTATFNLTAVPTYGLSVVMNGAGGGNVVSASSGISCSTGTCSANFNVGSSVTLTATPSADSGFAGWSGGGCSGNGTCVASMNAAQRVIATFALISPPPTPTGLSAGGDNACAITSSGGVQCWGYKQITGTASDSAIPVAIGGLLGPVTAVSVGQTHACALTVAGAVQCWGFNGNGELGNGTTTTSAVPTLVTGLSSGVIGIAAGNLNGCAVKNTGAVVCWGHNGSGQLGTAAAGLVKSLTPVTINGLPSGVVKVVVGISHMCTLTGAGAVHCWGDNAYGTLGNGVFINSATPVAVSGLASGIVGLNASSAGGRHTCAVGNTGVVKCWGLNTYGQLGDGTAGAQSKSTPVTALGLPAGLSSVAAGNSHTCFMTGAGAVWCVGSNASGQLGNGTTIDSVTPVAVTGITSSSVLIAAGGGHTCAQASSGTVQCWGLNAQGQVGDGTKLNQLAPVSVSGLVLNATLPGAPIIGTVTGGNAQAVVNFTGPSGNGGAAVNLYTVTASPGGAITTGATSPITVNGLTNGIAYAFTVAASNSVGLGATSAASNLVTPTGDLGQTISLAPPLTNVMVGGTGTLTVSGGASGNAVSLASATPAVCSVSNNLVTGHTAGSCTIVANQAGSANYLAAPQATLTFAVGKGSQSISLGAAPTVKVGATGTTSGLASSGLPVSYSSLTPTVCSVLPSAGVSATVKGLAAGSCVVAVNQGGDGNYNAAASVSMSISIGKASQTIIFGAVPTAFVGGTSTISATASSGLAVSYASTSPAICKVTGNTVAAVSAGSCVIVADQAGDANYMVAAQVSQNIAIGKASQTITFWAPPSLVAGRADTVLAVASSGLPVSYRSTTPTVCTLSGTSVLGLTPGNCSIAANQAGTADYSPATEATQSFVVGQGAQSITFGSAPALIVGATGTLSATGGSSGNEVIFTTTSADICTVSGVNGATVKGVAQGICIIAANQAGNTNYAAAVPATQSITVGQGFTQSISFAPGWNLLGNSLNQALSVLPTFADTAIVSTVWKWDVVKAGWQFYTPLMSSSELQAYAASKGFGVLSVINPGEGYWVNAKAAASLGTLNGAAFTLTSANLTTGWNLVATGSDVRPSAFNLSLSLTPPTPGAIPANLTTLWAWDNALSRWYFYAPTLESSGDLAAYIAGKGYLDFVQSGKTLGNGVGFWVNRP